MVKRIKPAAKVQEVHGKGLGLVAQQDIPAGTFVEEYIGEVMPLAEGKKRLAQYKAAGRVHTYVMNLSAAEVIDATVKGGAARFINHSCDPNCETQKWQVRPGLLGMGYDTGWGGSGGDWGVSP
jgi:histone-lysine N-methyltransferase SETD2